MALGAQQDMQTAIAEPTLLGRQLSQSDAEALRRSGAENGSERSSDRR
jgi:hypothetical protein